jgi:hypothetical protein
LERTDRKVLESIADTVVGDEFVNQGLEVEHVELAL